MINPKTWQRYAHFRRFYDEVQCSISLCSEIDVTNLLAFCKAENRSFYVTMLYLAARVVNSHEEFRITAVDAPEYEFPMPAVWNRLDVTHNIFRESSETYVTAYTVYTSDFDRFYHNCAEDIERAKSLPPEIIAVPAPGNTFEVSCTPWRHFTSVGVEGIDTLTPIITWGRFRDSGGKMLLPMSIQIKHASADGYHLARFFNEIEDISSHFADII